MLNDNTRGATIEAVISRMKTIQAAMGRSSVENFLPKLRFVAVSATIPNIEDVNICLCVSGQYEKCCNS